MSKEWINEAPVEPGTYWMYGDLYFGFIGADYLEGAKPNYGLHLVTVYKTAGKSLTAVAEGQVVSLVKADLSKHAPGWTGLWQEAELPELPAIN